MKSKQDDIKMLAEAYGKVYLKESPGESSAMT